MPFTPFHFGPAVALKAAVPRQFSFFVFCFAQCVADTEVLVFMARGEYPIHRFFHTYLGALVVGMISLAVGWPVRQRVMAWWDKTPGLPLKEYFKPEARIGFIPAFAGAFAGSFSHVLLDSFMHADMLPLKPFSSGNALLGGIGSGALHLFCFLSGLIGIAVWVAFRNRRS